MTRGRGIEIAIGVLLTVAGCRSKAAPVPPPSEPLQYDDERGLETRDGEEPDREGTPKTTRPGTCAGQGTPWDGKQEGCLYEVQGCCYPDARAACVAAGCEGEGCQVLEFSPAQITCR